ncbi:Mitochondrial import inner membrane translocase subunit Tim29 [Trinorchestia longiramus]|nr:Mitochondrial import inner membrane translocase subunit Tim29 [Trinorchestia longiramus]
MLSVPPSINPLGHGEFPTRKFSCLQALHVLPSGAARAAFRRCTCCLQALHVLPSADYWVQLGRDYRESLTTIAQQARERPLKASFYASLVAACVLLTKSNPTERDLRNRVLEHQNTAALLGEATRNKDIQSKMTHLEECFTNGTLRNDDGSCRLKVELFNLRACPPLRARPPESRNTRALLHLKKLRAHLSTPVENLWSLGGPWAPFGDHGPFWGATDLFLGATGPLWEITGLFGGSRAPLGGHGPLWEATGPFGRPRAPLGGHGPLWEATGPFGRPRAPLGGHWPPGSAKGTPSGGLTQSIVDARPVIRSIVFDFLLMSLELVIPIVQGVLKKCIHFFKGCSLNTAGARRLGQASFEKARSKDLFCMQNALLLTL